MHEVCKKKQWTWKLLFFLVRKIIEKTEPSSISILVVFLLTSSVATLAICCLELKAVWISYRYSVIYFFLVSNHLKHDISPLINDRGKNN